jgi:hypothetical protein
MSIEHKDGSITRIEFEDSNYGTPEGDGWLQLNWNNVRNQRFGYHHEEAEIALENWERYAAANPDDVETPYARVVQVAEPIPPYVPPENISPYFHDEIPF